MTAAPNAAFGLATLVVAAVVAACQPQAVPGSGASPSAPGGGSVATGAPGASPSIGAGGWTEYRSEAGGFALEIPAGWVAGETIEAGALLVTLGPPDGSSAIVIRVPASADLGAPDIPNVRCLEIEVGGLPARRCRDTVSGGDVTVVTGPGGTYEIANLGKQSSEVYEHVLDSFVILVPR